MNAQHDLERDLALWMADVVPLRAPDHLAPSVVARTRSVRPRPGWLARLLEAPMQTQVSLRRAVGFGRSPRLILAAVLIVALAAAAILVGSRIAPQQALPPPFGLADNGLIAADVDGSILLMQPDGAGARRLELPYPHVRSVVFSRDGTRLAAWAAESRNALVRSLIVAKVDGSPPTELGTFTGPMDDGVGLLAWSPDQTALAFTDASALHIVLVADGSTRRIAPDDVMAARQDPTWGPDGRLAYRCQTRDGRLHLCVRTADLASERILETSPGTDYAFSRSSWSHDGTRIAYQVDDAIDHPASAPGYDVATIDLATGEETILSRGVPEHMILPVWTPDNRYILTFGAIVAADNSGVRLVGDGRCAWTEPSPDGRFLTCITDGPGIELWPVAGGPPTLIRLDGQAEVLSWQRVAR